MVALISVPTLQGVMFELGKISDPPGTKTMSKETKIAQDEALRLKRIIDQQSNYISLSGRGVWI